MQPDAQPAPGPSRNAPRRWPFRLVTAGATLLVVALVIGVTLIPLVLSPWSLIVHFECRPGVAIATQDLWTPEVLVNAPYGGFGNGTGSVVAETALNTTVSNASAEGLFELREWTVATPVRTLVAGPGANAFCGSYLATSRTLGDYASHTLLAMRNATSDAGQNVSFSFFGHDSVVFHNGYAESDFTVGTCHRGGVRLATNAAWMAVEIPFAVGGSNRTVPATIQGAFNYTYSLPGGFGVWSIDDLNLGANAPGGGYAFSYTPCA